MVAHPMSGHPRLLVIVLEHELDRERRSADRPGRSAVYGQQVGEISSAFDAEREKDVGGVAGRVAREA